MHRLLQLLLITTAISVCSCNSPKKKVTKKRPNIIFMMADDHTPQAISGYDGVLGSTPNIDKLMEEGMRFNHCYVTNAICGPSRAVALTGKLSHINGVTDNGKDFDSTQLTYPKVLKANGYQTAVVGKWHLGSTPEGFDYYSVLPGQGHYYSPEFIEKEGNVIYEGEYVTDVITRKAMEWIGQREEDKPFALIYQFKAPHRNWMPAERFLNLYEDTVFPEPKTLFDNYEGRGTAAKEQEMRIGEHMWDAWDFKLASREELEAFGAKNKPSKKDYNAKQSDIAGANKRDQDLAKFYAVWNRMNDAQKDAWHKTYDKRLKEFKELKLEGKALISWKYQNYIRDYLRTVNAVDENIGKMMKYLEEIGELDNTIIVYTSDQGFHLGENGYFDKRFMYESSYKMPLVIRYPKMIEKGSQTDALSMNLDFAPTILDLCGVNVPNEMQGESLLPVLSNKGKIPTDWRTATYYHYYEYPSWHSVKRHYGIRTKDYKLIHFYNDVDEWELYDLKNDPNEMQNVAQNPEYSAILAELVTTLNNVQSQYQDEDPMEKEKEYFTGVNHH
ncbi:sulfatase family protein [Flammeovirga aprica]|uniref:Sulfatase n=1 Tax=Flammeovirga aprica JL-4 TaxID=694437 RepID=A0A7X9P197_9BACT|nr:sulfatase [Flammeovirga aprica]NME66809.1 sulfatase [Flammeovirga aprica JL-4]